MSDIAAQTLYEQFVELHRGPEAFIMPNAWDVPSALIFKEAGFKSIATSSAAFAATLGRIDGIHAVSRDTHLDHAALLTSVSGLPINGDFEDGYGETPEEVRATVEAAIARGLAGIGVEDTTGDPSNPAADGAGHPSLGGSGTVLRCRACEAIVARVAHTPRGTWLVLRIRLVKFPVASELFYPRTTRANVCR